MSSCCTSKKRKIDIMIQNPELLRLRLSPQEKYYYTNLFYEHSINEKVSCGKFPALLGLLGTDIAENFAIRIFDTFSSDKKSIRLSEYLKYVDVYHYGDENERCLITFKLMDRNGDGQITLSEFEDYLSLIIAAIKKVNPGATDYLISSQEIKMLFKKLTNNNKSVFSYQDFEKVYSEKPELLSWIDYFKNNDDEVLLLINNNLRELLAIFHKFFSQFSEIMSKNINENCSENNITSALDSINRFCKVIEKKRKFFMKSVGGFNIRTIFENLSNPFSNDNFDNVRNKAPKSSIVIRKNNKSLFDFSKKGNHRTDSSGNIIPEKKLQSNVISVTNTNDNPLFPQICNPEWIKKSLISLKHNIHDEIEIKDNTNSVIKEENLDNENDEDPYFDKDNKLNGKMNSMTIKLMVTDTQNNYIKDSLEGLEPSTLKNYNDDIVNLDNYYDETLTEKGFVLDEEDIKIKFNKHEKIHMKRRTILEANQNHTDDANFFDKNMNINKKSDNNNLGSILNKLNLKNLNVELEKEKQITYTDDRRVFFKKIKKLCDISAQTIEWIERSYKWVENKYLKNKIKNKKNLHPIKDPSNDLRFSVTNIPKSQSKSFSKVKIKNKNNLLKAADDNFKILLNMIMGIQLSVQSTPNITLKINEDMTQYLNSLTYSIQTINFGKKRQETFYIKEYGGIIFNNIRKFYDVDKDTFISSISPQDFITEMMVSSSTIIEELCSTGKSGSLFYYTRDGKYIIKTISFTEYAFLKKILPNYFRHLYSNRNSLLPKFMGCYKLVKKVKKSKSRTYFIVMQNIFSTNKEIHLRYDLKGSRIGRQVLKQQQLNNLKGIKISYALKDLDLENNKHYFYIGDKKISIMEQLKNDTQFLMENNIIDYSLLVGIHILDIEMASCGRNILDSPLRAIKNKYQSSAGLPQPLNTHQDVSNCSPSLNENLEMVLKESHSMHHIKRVIESADEDEEKINISEANCSFFDMDIKYSDNESAADAEIRKSTHNQANANQNLIRDYEDGGIKSLTNKEIYFIGIIDILTEYNTPKKIEFVSKLIYYCSNKMSCIPPHNYQVRFNNYMDSRIVGVAENSNVNK